MLYADAFNFLNMPLSNPVLDEKDFYTEEQLEALFLHPLPQHVAIIMDGNRRWSKKQISLDLRSFFSGHWKGAEVVETVIEASLKLHIKQLTLFAFSTENWKRSPAEVHQLKKILSYFLKKNRTLMRDLGVSFQVIGDLSPFPVELVDEIQEVIKGTAAGCELTLVLALNYGGRDEISRACKKVALDCQLGKLSADQINETLFESYLDTAKLPFAAPDLLIRTSGEQRISNFLLWQLAYSEVYVTKTLWPDFTPQDLYEAVKAFQLRERRLGK